jgi:hypothetical protein
VGAANAQQMRFWTVLLVRTKVGSPSTESGSWSSVMPLSEATSELASAVETRVGITANLDVCNELVDVVLFFGSCITAVVVESKLLDSPCWQHQPSSPSQLV